MAGLAHGIFIADHDRRLHLVAELQQRMLRIAPQHKSNAALTGALGDVRNSLRQKCVVPQVRVWVKRHRRKEDDNRLTEGVGNVDGCIERWVVEGALGTLHPVNDAAAVGVGRAGSANRYTGIGGDRFEFGHGWGIWILAGSRRMQTWGLMRVKGSFDSCGKTASAQDDRGEVSHNDSAASTSSAMAAASTADRTSCTRTMWAPRRMLVTMAASDP